ncbi:MAG: hypothetical protein WCX65_19880 [bacterium]
MKTFLRMIAALLIAGMAHGAAAVEKPFVKDEKYPQKWATLYTEKDGLPGEGVNSLAYCGDKLYAGSGRGIYYFESGKWRNAQPGDGFGLVTKIACDGDGMLVGSREGFFRVSLKGEMKAETLLLKETTAFAAWRGGWLVGTAQGLFNLKDGKAERIEAFGTRPVTALAVDGEGAAWVGFLKGLARYDGEHVALYRHSYDGESLIDNNVRDLYLSKSGDLYIATGGGVSRFDRKQKWTDINGKKTGMPYEDALTVAGSNGMLWVGTTIGAERYDGKEWEYFESKRYLPDDRVVAIAAAPDGGAWFGTPGGVSRIEYRMMTLADKAAYLEKQVRERHVRYGLVSDSSLTRPGDLSSNVLATSDNDGLWTAMYIGAECYRYAATKDPEAKKFARQSMEALMKLENITGVPGFVARSFAKPDDQHCQGEWDHITPDGKWRWKGDTSSDEIDGHYYANAIYYDLCADENEKKEIEKNVRALTNHIIDNDYYLIDTDGKPTSFGMWNPEYLRTRGRFQQGLNSLEILAYLRTAIHITGDQKFMDSYMLLIKKHNYAKHMVKQKINQPRVINHSDDELAFLAYYPLLKYETNSFLQKYYHESITRSWKIDRPEMNPLWNFIYGAVMPDGTEFDPDKAVYTLRKLSPDLVYWSIRNSHRADIERDTKGGRFNEVQAVKPLPPDERCMMKWNENPFMLDCPYGGYSEEAATFWLLPYWMGRYYGFIK